MLNKMLIVLLAAATQFEAPAVDQVDFEREVLPMLRASCFECHSAEKSKPKAGLRLDGASWIRAGAKGGSVLQAGNASQSELYLRVALPADDLDIMPPEGDVMTKEQIATLERWIDQGANFGTWTGVERPAESNTEPKVVKDPPRIRVWRELGRNLKPVPEASIDKSLRGLAVLEPVFPQSPLLRISFLSHEAKVDDRLLEKLAPLRTHIAHLNLARTDITDLDVLKGATALTHLDLRSTQVGDKAVRSIAGLTELRSLNLYETQVTDESLVALAKLPKLTDLYLWKSKVTREGVTELKRKNPELHVRWEPGIP